MISASQVVMHRPNDLLSAHRGERHEPMRAVPTTAVVAAGPAAIAAAGEGNPEPVILGGPASFLEPVGRHHTRTFIRTMRGRAVRSS